MTESTKTFVFVGVAALCVAAAVATRPQAIDLEREAQSRTGKPLVARFDPEEAARLRITRFNEETATLSEFEVAERDGVWTLPSKSGYPADAEKQMGEAAAGVMDREVLRIASKLPADHEQYGVVDPKSSKLAVGQTGVGVRVAMLGSSDKPLIDLIIGKKVKDAENQRYVRLADQDVVYVVDVDPSKFSTKFDDWIEDDLLKINPWDLAQVSLDNYSASAELGMTPDGRIVPQLKQSFEDQLTLTYDDGAGEWQAKRMAVYDDVKQGYQEVSLSEGQELDAEKLRELKDALDNLKIVDVERKPEGLSGSLKAGEDFLKDTATIESLARRGFLAVGRPGGGVELISSEGEFTATMKDGVEYVLRFGDLQADEEDPTDPAAGPEAAGSEAAGANPADADSKDAGGVNRYLFVMAQFNEDAIEKPVLEELPALPESKADAKEEPASEDAAADGEDAKQRDTEETDAVSDEPEAGAEEAEKTDDAAEGDQEPEADEDGSDELLEEVIARRKEIEASNQRKLDAYQEKIKAGKERVKELNARFGDWYYVISNPVYQKIHLTHDAVVKVKEKPEGESEEGSTPPAGAGGIQGLPNLGGMLGTGAPAADDNEPAMEESAPAAEDAAPEAEETEPEAQETEPSAEESEPSAEESEPTAEEGEDGADGEGPVEGGATP